MLEIQFTLFKYRINNINKNIVKGHIRQTNKLPTTVYGTFIGLPAGLTGMFPYAAIDLSTFMFTKIWLHSIIFLSILMLRIDICQTMVFTTFTGAISGSIRGFNRKYTPINLLRTRLQAQGTFAHKHTYMMGFDGNTSKNSEKKVLKGLYKGLFPNLVKVCPSVAIKLFIL